LARKVWHTAITFPGGSKRAKEGKALPKTVQRGEEVRVFLGKKQRLCLEKRELNHRKSGLYYSGERNNR
jgi:hypothetical protein